MKGLVILALTMVAVCTIATGTQVKDSVVLRVFNKGLEMPDSEMLALLKRANLESHGYKKEVINKSTRRPGSSKPEYTRTVHYYKMVPCDKAYEVEKELDRLLGGLLGKKVLRKTRKDLSNKNINDPSRMCRAGIEVHFRNQQRCRMNAKSDPISKRSHRICWISVLCVCILWS